MSARFSPGELGLAAIGLGCGVGAEEYPILAFAGEGDASHGSLPPGNRVASRTGYDGVHIGSNGVRNPVIRLVELGDPDYVNPPAFAGGATADPNDPRNFKDFVFFNEAGRLVDPRDGSEVPDTYRDARKTIAIRKGKIIPVNPVGYPVDLKTGDVIDRKRRYTNIRMFPVTNLILRDEVVYDKKHGTTETDVYRMFNERYRRVHPAGYPQEIRQEYTQVIPKRQVPLLRID